MLRLDYISCGLTISSTILIGRKRWEGWIVAALNSVLICLIRMEHFSVGVHSRQRLLSCFVSYNLWEWSKIATQKL